MKGLLNCCLSHSSSECRSGKGKGRGFCVQCERSFCAGEGGSLTVEAMLVVPLLLLALFLCIGLVFGVHGAMVLDNALAAASSDLAENAYLLRQASVFGTRIAAGSSESGQGNALGDVSGISGDLAQFGAGILLAEYSLNKYLHDYPELSRAIAWRYVKLPSLDESSVESDDFDVGLGLLQGAFAFGFTPDPDDIVLVLGYTPAKINGFTALLPESWHLTLVKRERAWLVGRALHPGRGAEQAAGQDENGPLVYITRWGEKYHEDDCRYLAKSKFPAYLNKLSKTYDACSVCKPPPRQQMAPDAAA